MGLSDGSAWEKEFGIEKPKQPKVVIFIPKTGRQVILDEYETELLFRHFRWGLQDETLPAEGVLNLQEKLDKEYFPCLGA